MIRFLIFCILSTINLNAQNLIKVEYNEYLDYEFPITRPQYLYIDKMENSSFLLIDFVNEKTGDLKMETQADALTSLGRSIGSDYILLDLDKKELKIYEDFARKIYKIEDTFPVIAWELKNEEKKINALTARKAIGKYRGKTWEVWYTPEIPYSFGPWKLNGLPGLILEAKEETGKITFKAFKIEYDVLCNNCNEPSDKLTKTVSQKEFLLLQDDFYNNIEARLPRGTTVSYSKINFLVRELKFEFPIKFSWEQELKK